jgi:hypothetical protein
LERTPRFVVNLDFFGADPGFAFEFLNRPEEVKEGDQRCIHGGQEGLFCKALKPVIADVFTDDGAIFLFDKTVVVFLAAAGEGIFSAAYQISVV